ncbi:hypothetical protein KXX16_005307 [Aspergillus fumigatus]|uniref:Glyoxalase family protein n=1 Tax=Aspergillus fumigatus (strain CBS 144.89 / FGSC A1163 / CEA10) TaxID=451804 RepID=B0XZ37_ASPFC|nr:glyoxalase family protein [Aspergillus fumigatus A1163]KAF4262750.1 hypothetical protein CNMCM8714_008792 [Aspergillus fumigatus]KAF4265459.1 hypothetical protein CNMCM8812_003125 [Aspergillus fumigatus]KAF4285799.1 hypothetical protein CNMCM8689_004011 [Aspergillus fumigatus]KAH1319018.1 hypothetical protein KXX47_002202 [Aspergillus fumigatus]
MPLSHLTLTVSHLPTSTSFFLSCLQPLGYQFIGRHDDYIGFGQKSGEPADFWITEQKPGSPAGAAHVAFPAPSKDAVGSFFISALKAGAKIHGEPKTRDTESGYYSAAVIDFDGNSIEAVYRPGISAAKSEVSASPIGLLENGSVVSRASTKVSSVKPQSIAPSVRSEAKSCVSRATTAVERVAPSERTAPTIISREVQQAPSPTYIVNHTTHTTQKKDDSTAKTIVGSLIGAAAGAAIAYALTKSESQSQSSEATPPPQYTPRDFPQLASPSQAPSLAQEHQDYRAIDAPPARSTFSRSDARSTLTRSVSSKNPRASTIYEGTEFVPPRGENGSVYLDESGRRASDGSVYTVRDIPLRAIEYPPPARSTTYPCNPSTLISSFPDKSRFNDKESVYSASTAKPSKANHQDHHSSRHSSHQSAARSMAGSTASSARTARQVPLPEGSVTSYASYRSGAKSGVSAREIPLPQSVVDDFEIQTNITPDDSISQVDFSRRSSYSHQSHRSKAPSHASKRSSKFDEPVQPSDSVSQVSTNVSKTSQRTIKANGSIAGGASKAPSKAPTTVSSRRGSQVA